MKGEASIFKCKNENCQTPLGVSQGASLMVGAVKFGRSVTLDCAVCNRRNFWTPEKVAPVVVDMRTQARAG